MALPRHYLQAALKDSTSALGFKRSRMRQAFVVGQMTLSLVLLIGAGLFTRALSYGQSVYPGREPETVMTATLDPRVLGYTVAQARELYRQLTDNIAALPGVEGVSLTRELSIGGGFARTGVFVEDAPGLGSMATETSTIAPRYFETLGVRLISGRDFTAADREGAPTVVIINEAMARRYWPNASPLGKRVRFDENEWAEIVGVAEDGRYRIAGHSPGHGKKRVANNRKSRVFAETDGTTTGAPLNVTVPPLLMSVRPNATRPSSVNRLSPTGVLNPTPRSMLTS